MAVKNSMAAKSTFAYILALVFFMVKAPEPWIVDELQLNVVVIGDIGLRESDSVVKKTVVNAILLDHQAHPFHLGINLGGNVYPKGSTTGDFQTLNEIFALSFPSDVYRFNFLSTLGKVDHDGDVYTQLDYFKQESRFHMPQRNFFYDVKLRDNTLIRFLVIDSTPLYDPDLSDDFLIIVTPLNRQLQLEETERLLDDSSQFDYVFLIMNHNVVSGCGPHTYVPNDPPFNRVVFHRHLTAILTAYNHNMQVDSFNNEMHGRLVIRPPVITVGNSAQTEEIQDSSAQHAYICKITSRWCKSPPEGGYGQLVIAKEAAIFNFIAGNGQVLHQEKLNKARRT
ncbi:hypothetical protein RF11_09224 [Thelohanellus kitauei]|uniref:Uncharacterized protein n=1 Tax=Thelohanellus kitauei TaxID=669202 RepID=A0A0C2N4D9_THEKT|nr:hypothetical protein RF11_09224 [Thelohanellus kitauei]